MTVLDTQKKMAILMLTRIGWRYENNRDSAVKAIEMVMAKNVGVDPRRLAEIISKKRVA
ncbi:hypothetical protein [Periweissella cryptocerci]|uniref:hypothetical protein n=1 Tax=Periweissella cryptocerci TaxID=2506420 RepID=UPI001404D4CA|nr:hypothetical protein [Periweissella cryptocerci]